MVKQDNLVFKERVNPSFQLEDITMTTIITYKDAQYALDIVKTICEEVGLSLPGISQEQERAMMVKFSQAAKWPQLSRSRFKPQPYSVSA